MPISAKYKKQYAKLSKKQKEELRKSFSYMVYTPYWTSFRKLKKHLIENNESIELIEIK